MAELRGAFTIADVAINSTTATLVQVASPANQRVAINGIYLSQDAAIATKLVLATQTTAGTMTTGTPQIIGPGSETIQSTWLHTATVEPTFGANLAIWEATGGLYLQFSRDDRLILPSNTRWGFIITSGGSANYTMTIDFEE